MSNTEKTRLLLLLTSTAGGVGLNAYYLARGLPRDEFDVTIAYGPGYPLDAAIERLDVPVVHLSLSRKLSPWANARGFLQVYGLLRRQPFDMIVTQCSMAGLVGRVAGRLAGVPHRLFVTQLFACHTEQPLLKRSLYRLVERGLDRLTTHYVAVCEGSRRFGVQSGIMAPDKVTVIHNSVALDKLHTTRSPEEVCARLGLDPCRPIVGTALRFEPQKGLVFLLRAATVVKRELPGVQFLIAGDGPMRDDLHALATSLELDRTVHFIGWRDDLPDILQCMDVFCHPTLWEQLPHMVLEALALRRPVVATAVDGVPEIVLHDETGLLVPPRDPAALAAAVLDLLRDPDRARRLGEAGRRLVEERFTADKMVESYAGLFRRLSANGQDRAAGFCVKSTGKVTHLRAGQSDLPRSDSLQ
ncbi:MAG: glycosyltransferase [Planctomycetota bacterium]